VRSNFWTPPKGLPKGSRHTVEGVLLLRHEPAFELNDVRFDEVFELLIEDSLLPVSP